MSGPAGERAPRDPERTSSNPGEPMTAERLAAELAPLIAALPSAPPAGALLDAQGAAGLLNVPPSWVLAEARADRIPHVRLGRYVRFQRDELEAWWQTRARGPRQRRTGLQPASTKGDPR